MRLQGTRKTTTQQIWLRNITEQVLSSYITPPRPQKVPCPFGFSHFAHLFLSLPPYSLPPLLFPALHHRGHPAS